MTITQTGRRLALVGLLALIGALLPLTGASAIDGDEALELSGDSNTAISIANSEVVYTPLGEAGPDNPPTNVLIGREDVFADNLASGALQGAAAEGDNGAPLLLTGTDALDADVEAEITRLGATSATILGGTAAISEDVEAELTELLGDGNVSRLEGLTRTETAIAVAGESGADTALLVRSGAAGDDATQAFADSLGAGALAATNGYSVLFTQTEVLTGSTAEFLASEGAPSSVIIVGGTAAISEDTEAEVVEILGEENVSRVSGATRFDTAVELNGLRDADTLGSYAIAVDGQGDDSWADGFSMANLSGLNNAPVVLTNQGMVPEATETYLESINENAARAHLTDTFIVCGASAAGDACAALAEIFGLTVVPWPPAEPAPGEDNTGIVTFVDTGADTYSYQPADGSAETDVTYANDDANEFSVDGNPATYEVFEAQLTVGDTITVTVDDAGTPDDDSDDVTTHALVNVAAAETGTVGNVNVAADEFDIIEPVSGATISAAPIDYAGGCDLYQLNGGVVIAAQFEAALNEGDTYDTSEDAAGNVTCMLTDRTVSGTVTVVDTVTADTDTFEIGNLGDDFAGTNDDTFVASMAKFDAGDLVINVDGTAITDYQDFADVISSGDQAEYSRTNDTETISLTNGLPTTVSGQAIDDADATDGFDIATNPGTETAPDPQAADRFIIDGVLGTEANFGAAYSAGDDVSYTPADGAAGTPATYTLTNQDLAGEVANPNIGGNAYDVLSDAGDVVLETVIYGGGDRFFVNGEEVLEPDFEDDPDSEDDLQGIIDGDVEGTILIEEGLTGNNHNLTTTEA